MISLMLSQSLIFPPITVTFALFAQFPVEVTVPACTASGDTAVVMNAAVSAAIYLFFMLSSLSFEISFNIFCFDFKIVTYLLQKIITQPCENRQPQYLEPVEYI